MVEHLGKFGPECIGILIILLFEIANLLHGIIIVHQKRDAEYGGGDQDPHTEEKTDEADDCFTFFQFCIQFPIPPLDIRVPSG